MENATSTLKIVISGYGKMGKMVEQVLAQREDLPKDIENPLYEYGFGIDAEGFGR